MDPRNRLDAEAAALCHHLAGTAFPWDITRALELALLKTFCLPSISALLSRTGEFEQRPRKRYDDTGLMVAELLRHGPDSPDGLAVIQRLNRIHGHYAIANADFLYVLSGFVAEPIRWLEHYGWRPLTAGEQQALFRFWRHVGERMGITGLPASLEQLLALNNRVEASLFAAAACNRRVADATLAMLLADWPSGLRPPLAVLLRGGLGLALRARSRLVNGWQRLHPPRRSRFYSERPTPSYGRHFQLEQLGPPPLLEGLNQARWSGQQRRIGLTGGIASGKSTVGRLLEARGLPVLDADLYAREALAPGSPGAQAVRERYGERLGGEGPEAIDRATLGRIVFADQAERRWLEQLVHPLVRQRFEAELKRWAAAPVVVLMVPLLFEAGLEGLCSEVWLVDCAAEHQLRRLMARDGLPETEARDRIAAQWPLERKRALADLVLDNRGPAEALHEQLTAALAGGAGDRPAQPS
ncbi:dephospho-CoA kinase [Cyanobium sp. ATX 6A2]|uniref:dephospho-CoA kinase n=1 Tax=Cyanobium sp. ATX 6A2 TaxID=2823700 RepID=UPI0028F45B6A|nr:dephospho-CoA kinase [Cyanobium sp. ATX 6A2]MCP9887562.1 dephospho-CoA kinase [Cyanobium sp. ATX 6A2]